jgi:hypothetical protein
MKSSVSVALTCCAALAATAHADTPNRSFNNAVSNLCLGVQGVDHHSAGANVEVYTCSPGGGDKGCDNDWIITPAGGGFSFIKNRVSGLCLGVKGVDRHGPGALAEVYNCNPGGHDPGLDMQWRIVDEGNGLSRLENRVSNLCLGVQGVDNHRAGALVEVYTCNPGHGDAGRDNRWKLNKSSRVCWDPAPSGSKEKPGNNGSVSCNEFCRNAYANWGPYGQCTGGRVEWGSTISCDQRAGAGSNVTCYCKMQPPPPPPGGTFEKHNDNGSATCSQYCENAFADWGQYGLCEGSRVDDGPLTGSGIGCDQTLPSLGNVTCYCRSQVAPRKPVPPQFSKRGNNGTATCHEFCEGVGHPEWGPQGTCVDGGVIGGKFRGKQVGCDTAVGFGSSVECVCNPAARIPDPPPGAWVKPAENNGTVSCADFCENTQQNWGPSGVCAGGDDAVGGYVPGPNRVVRCGEVPGVTTKCFCKNWPTPPKLTDEVHHVSTTDSCSNACSQNGYSSCLFAVVSDGRQKGKWQYCDLPPLAENKYDCACFKQCGDNTPPQNYTFCVRCAGSTPYEAVVAGCLEAAKNEAKRQAPPSCQVDEGSCGGR